MRCAIALLLLINAIAFAADKSSDPEPDSFDVEPPVLIPNRSTPLTASSAVVRSALGANLRGAVYRFRFARREAQLVEEALA